MMSCSRWMVLVGVAGVIWGVAGGAVAAAEAAASVKGVLTANGVTVELPYVYVYAEKEGFYDPSDPTWTVLFVEHEIEPRDLDEHIWDAAYVRLGITRTAQGDGRPELQVYSQDIRLAADAHGNISGGTYPQLELSELDAAGCAGRVWLPQPETFFDDTFQYDFRFSAPLSDPSAPVGDPLPEGGGEPGAAYVAWVEAVHAGDVARIRTLLPPEQAAMLEASDSVAEDLEFLKFAPQDILIILISIIQVSVSSWQGSVIDK